MATLTPLSHYIEFRLRPDPEIAATHLLAAVYTRLHRTLAIQGTTNIAVTFPDYSAERYTLGQRLRLHSSEAALENWEIGNWLGSLRDHVSASKILLVPADAQHRTLRRVQVKSNPERLRRRLMKRHQLSEEQAQARIPDSVARTTHLPFLQLASSSTAQQFKLFLALGAAQDEAQVGCFNKYGLSNTATVPWF